MPSTTTQTSIINRALQMIGSQPVSSINENSRGARACNTAYYPTLYSELRKNFWNFSIQRASLAASATTPLFGKSFYYPLPPDYLDLANPDQDFNNNSGYLYTQADTSYNATAVLPAPFYDDFIIEYMPTGQLAITSNFGSPISIRYVSSNVTEGTFDACFAEAFAAAIAVSICEEVTNSNAKVANAEKIYLEQIRMARKRNAFEQKPVDPPTDTWLNSRF